MRARWLSKRTVPLHLAALVFVPGCVLAGWWQVTRAEDGNQLSYLYMVMWPCFALLGIVFWWMLVHTDYDSAGLRGMRRQQALHHEWPTPGRTTAPAVASPKAWTGVPTSQGAAGLVAEVSTMPPTDPVTADDPELAAYNARLAALSTTGAKTWRRRESVVVRRAR